MAGGVMQDAQNRGAHLRMVDPLQPGRPWPPWSKGRRERGCSRRSGAVVVAVRRPAGGLWLVAGGWLLAGWVLLIKGLFSRRSEKNIFFWKKLKNLYSCCRPRAERGSTILTTCASALLFLLLLFLFCCCLLPACCWVIRTSTATYSPYYSTSSRLAAGVCLRFPKRP
jgi:hypothetical protein